MKNYINKIFGCAILASATMLASCGSDYLETKPTSSVGSGEDLRHEALATWEDAGLTLEAACFLAGQYAYDDNEHDTNELTLRGGGEEINDQL